MWTLPNHKHLITTVVDRSNFLKIIYDYNLEKNVRGSKMILVNILQNVAVYLFFFTYYIITQNDTFLYRSTNQVSLSWVSIVGCPGITWDNCYILLFTFPSEIIWSLKIFNIKQLSKSGAIKNLWLSSHMQSCK